MTLPSVPDLKVEIAFDNDPLTVSPTWVDISAYVRSTFGLSTNRGKQDELSTYAAGRCSFTLDNRSRLFDPSYAAGTYYGKLKPRNGVRVTATWNATDYVMFRGFVEGWPVAYPSSSKDATVTIEAFDLLALLSETELDDFTYAFLNSVTNLTVGLRKMQAGRWIDVVNGKLLPRRTGVDEFGDPMTTSPSDPVVFNGTTYFGTGVSSFLGTSNSTGGNAFWIQTTDTGSGLTIDTQAVIMAHYVQGDENYLYGIDSAGFLRAYFRDVGVSVVELVSLEKINDGKPHHVVLGFVDSRAAMFVDGLLQSDAIITGNMAAMGSIQFIGRRNPEKTGGSTFNGTLQDVWAWSGSLTADQVLDLYYAADGFLAESTAARFSRILSLADVPAGLIDATSKPAGVVGDLVTESAPALSQLQTVADSEQGRMFVSKDGKATLHDRYWWKTQTRGSTVQVTFADQPGAGEYPMSSLGFDYNVREVQNEITVTGSRSASYTASDSTSVEDYGTHSASVSTVLSSEAQVVDMATGLVLLRKTPVIRLDAITVQPARNTAMWPTVLGLEIGDRIKVQVTPRGVGSERSEELLLESISWQVSAESWTVQFKGSPVPTADFGTWDESGLTYDDGTLYAF